MIEVAALSGGVAVLMLLAYLRGHHDGNKDCERRWSEAVDRADAHREADRMRDDLHRDWVMTTHMDGR